MGVRIESVDFTTAPHDVVLAVAQLESDLGAEACPSEPRMVPELIAAEWRHPGASQRLHSWVAWSDADAGADVGAGAGQVAGYCILLTEERPDNQNLGYLFGGVRSGERRQRIGCRLLQEALAAAEAEGRELLTIQIAAGSPVEQFMASYGGDHMYWAER